MSDGARDDDIASDRPRPPARPARCIQSHRGLARRGQLSARAQRRRPGRPRSAGAVDARPRPDRDDRRHRQHHRRARRQRRRGARHVRLPHRHGRDRRPLRWALGLAGLEACEALNDAGRATRRPLALVAFTNEEGSRFAPYAMGSLVYVGGLALEDAYAIRGIDGATVGAELRRIGYAGAASPGFLAPHAYVELHIEQGPILESEGVAIGAVEGITGLAWTEVAITGRAAHAGATPMHLRRDAAWAAGEIAVFVRRLAPDMGGHQKGTVGRIELYPNLVNVVAERAVVTVDLRNTDDTLLQDAERQLADFLGRLAAQEQVAIATRNLARFAPVSFPDEMVSLIETTARELAFSCRRLPSGAGHDAQMMARLCPATMIFVPSVGGLSHNVREHTQPAPLEAGAAVLLHSVPRLPAGRCPALWCA